MRILLDEIPVDVQAHTVGEAVTAAASLAEDRGRMIVEVMLDDQPWTGDGSAVAPEGTLRCRTAEPAALARETLADAQATLVEIDQFQREAATLIESDRMADGMNRLARALGCWQQVQEAVALACQVLMVDLEEVRIDDLTLHDAAGQLEQQLRMMADALRSDDPIGLSDVLQYELPEVIQSWRALLAELGQITLDEVSK